METNKAYNLVAQSPHSTVVAEYLPAYEQDPTYQSEAALEQRFLDLLAGQGYEYIRITSEQALIANLRQQLQRLNNITFTDHEWQQFFHAEIVNKNHGIVEKTKTIQEDHIKVLQREDGTIKNIYLLDKQAIHDNHLQVINQYSTGDSDNAEDGARANRYDVTVLVNGMPLVHVELKRRGVAIQEAFNQINRYQRDSFWAGCGLFEYVQLFVISNGTHSKYYSNTTRRQHLSEQSKRPARRGRRSSNSFEFTSWWADAKSKQIRELTDFTKTFFAKHTLLNILTRYCVFTSDKQLMVMRPYQIAATERILNRIAVATNHKQLGSTDGGGYVWHTTGSGKTLTSFKASLLASKMDDVHKVLFVVDRKDLDYQTMCEYDKYQKGAANSSVSTAVLQQQLESSESRIIVTTIQKLARFVKANRQHDVYGRHVVLIFDECHRSQFGEMHTAITKRFKRYNLFGFTGTPVFAKNAGAGGNPLLKTTAQAFGDKLHTYTIVDAIEDKNVLPFRVDYVSTMRSEEVLEDKQVRDIDRERALLAPERVSNIVGYILDHFDQKTKRNSSYQLNERRLRGFNSIFTVASIDAAKKYYAEFQRQQRDAPSDKKLKIALIYSYCQNEDEGDGWEEENPEDTGGLDAGSREFLADAIADYNAMFGTSYDTSSERFQNYYKDVSDRVKNREVDLLLVVNMFLTGFDATTLNTLWVDKRLRHHGLLQAYSRTNRILNSIKVFGNIVCFRNLEQATNEAIALFGDKEAGGIVLLKPYAEYYQQYQELVARLLREFPLGKPIIGEQAKKEFIKLYGEILRLQNILSAFDDFAGSEILTPRQSQDYRGRYLDLYNEFRPMQEDERENINDDLVFEMELIKQVDINIDYILDLIRKHHHEQTQDREILVNKITKAVDASVVLRNKKELIIKFIETADPAKVVDDAWAAHVAAEKDAELTRIIAEEELNEQEARAFMQNAFRDGHIETGGEAFAAILPPISRFTPDGARTKKRAQVHRRLKQFHNRYHDI